MWGPQNSSRAKLETRALVTFGSHAYILACDAILAWPTRNPSTIAQTSFHAPTPLPFISLCRRRCPDLPFTRALAQISAGEPPLPLPPSPASLLPPPAPSYRPARPTPTGLLPPPAPSYPAPPTPAGPLPCASSPEKGHTTRPCCCPNIEEEAGGKKTRPPLLRPYCCSSGIWTVEAPAAPAPSCAG